MITQVPGNSIKIIPSLFKNKWFVIGLLAKLLFLFIFASNYLTDLFIPFIKSGVSGNLMDSYKDYFYLKPNAFPYPPVMLYILAGPGYLASLINDSPTVISVTDIFLIRLPLLLADIAILVVLIKLLRSEKHLIKWYWLNPIVLYISYIHGQLDIIPTAFLCISLYCLFKDRLWMFLIFITLACAVKFHIIITIPLLVVYLFKTKKVSINNFAKGFVFFLGFLLLLNMPFLFQNEYIRMVYQNSEQVKTLRSSFNIFDNYSIILIPAFYMGILYLIIDFRFINKDILLIFLALSFGIITFFIVPGQGWYMWAMPFLVYFMIRFNFHAKPLFVLLNIGYFLFFIIFPQSDIPLVAQTVYPEVKTMDNLYGFLVHHLINAEIPVQLAFTFMETSLLLFCVSIFRFGVITIRGQKIYHQPYLIGICGDSGTGKSTLSDTVQDLFGQMNTLVVKGDDMHRWERGHDKWNELTHLNPKANWLHRDLSQLLDLKASKRIYRRSYDHDTGTFTKEQAISPNKVIIYEGLHSFYLKGASLIYDLKIFMKPSEELRRYWKVKRDVEKRGYTKEKVIEAIEKRMGDSVSHILNQEAEADIVFSIENISAINFNRSLDDDVDTQLKIVCSNDIYFEQLLEVLRIKTNLIVSHDIDHVKQIICIQGNVGANIVQDVALFLGLDIEDLTGTNPVWREGHLGLMQLFILYQIISQFKRNGMMIRQGGIDL